MQTLEQSIEKLLGQAAIFATLNSEDLAPIARVSTKLKHAASTALFSQGEDAKHFFYIVSGSVRLYRLTAEGKEKVIEIIQAGETFAEAVALSDKPYPVYGETIDDSEIIWIPSHILPTLITENAALALKMLSSLSMRLHKFVNDIQALSMSSAEQKVAGYFLASLHDNSPNQRISLPSKKAIVASRLGLQPETLSRVLRKMKARGVIDEDETSIIILEPDMLKAVWDVT